MAWLAVDCGLRILDLTPELSSWIATALGGCPTGDAHRPGNQRGGPQDGWFLQAFEHDELDASALQVGLRGFLPPDEHRILATIDRIEAELTRTATSTATSARTACRAWRAPLSSDLVDGLSPGPRRAHRGRREVLDRVLDREDLGLLAGEIEPDTGEQIGNFPQGFSHLGVIGAASTWPTPNPDQAVWLERWKDL